MKKCIVSLVFVACLLVGLMLQLIPDASAADSGICGNNLTWSLNTDTGVLTISGMGDMDDYSYSTSAPWSEHQQSISAVEIAEGVTHIGAYAFRNLSSMATLSIPKGLKSIGDYAFENCPALRRVELTDMATWCEVQLFLPGKVFGNLLYFNGEPITELVIPQGVTFIGSHVFSQCTSLTSVTIPDSVKFIDHSAFEGCTGLKSINLPESVVSIGYSAFSGCSGLTKVILPKSITAITFSTFSDCEGLTEIVIPDNVAEIGQAAFCNCSALKSLDIPSSVTTIGSDAFFGCTALENVCLPDSVVSIGDGAFCLCSNLSEIYFPDSVKWIGEDVLNETPYYSNKENWTSGLLYVGKHLIKGEADLGGELFIPADTLTIAGKALYKCNMLTAVSIPHSVVSIGARAFYSCTNLSSIAIANNVSRIGSAAFHETAYFKDKENWDADFLYVGNHLIAADFNISGEQTIREGTITLADYLISMRDKLTAVNIPESVENIGMYAFHYCSNLTRVNIPSRVEEIRAGTFRDCYALPHIDLPEGLASIGAQAFSSCEMLREVQIPDSVTSIGAEAFANCTGLTGIDLPDGVTSIGDHAFDYDRALTHFVVPKSVEMIGERTFRTCRNLTKIFILNPDCEIYPTLDTLSSHKLTTIYGYKGSPAEEYALCHGYAFRALCECAEETAGEQTELVPPTCTMEGMRLFTCSVCEGTITERLPAVGHNYSYENLDALHRVTCANCGVDFMEIHRNENGVCVLCGNEASEEVSVDTAIVINHSLNLASDFAINFAVREELLAQYDSFYLETAIPVYEGNTKTGTTTLTIQPVLNGGYYYFTMDGLTAIQMNNVIKARLYASKDGKTYASVVDSYSIGIYAYNQLAKNNTGAELKNLCAELLRYGAKAQIFKAYRTNALVDASMAAEHKAMLTYLEDVEFGNNNTTLNDLSNPTVTWVGKALILDSKVTLRMIANLSSYSGALADLSVRVTYTNLEGEEVTEVVTDYIAYDESRGYYAFDFSALRAAELRTIVSAAVYAGDKQVSPTMQYSMDTYGNGKTGNLLTLCRALTAYSDAALAYFLK